jgi:serine/threonine protein kinase
MDSVPAMDLTEIKLKIVRRIGSGSNGNVYLAKGKKKRPLAVKVIQKNHNILSKQANEIQYLSVLRDHPNIVKLYRTVETEKFIYIIQEYCEQDLFSYIEAGISESTIRRLFKDLCTAVAYCHSQSIYHRDLKPENILLKNNTVKLCDFGLSTNHHLSDEFKTGSERYMSPEVYCDSSKKRNLNMPYFTWANDVWALGIILINMITMKNPWTAPSKKNEQFMKYRKDPIAFFNVFKFSDELVKLLVTVFDIEPFNRPSAAELSCKINQIPHFVKKQTNYSKHMTEITESVTLPLLSECHPVEVGNISLKPILCQSDKISNSFSQTKIELQESNQPSNYKKSPRSFLIALFKISQDAISPSLRRKGLNCSLHLT